MTIPISVISVQLHPLLLDIISIVRSPSLIITIKAVCPHSQESGHENSQSEFRKFEIGRQHLASWGSGCFLNLKDYVLFLEQEFLVDFKLCISTKMHIFLATEQVMRKVGVWMHEWRWLIASACRLQRGDFVARCLISTVRTSYCARPYLPFKGASSMDLRILVRSECCKRATIPLVRTSYTTTWSWLLSKEMHTWIVYCTQDILHRSFLGLA